MHLIGCNSEPAAPPPRQDAGPSAARGIHVRVVDPANGQPIACKLTLDAAPPGLSPVYGSSEGVGEWLAPNALGVRNTIYGDPCDVTIPLPPGMIKVTATQGFERELATAAVMVADGGVSSLTLELPRAIDTTGFACADFHVHSAPSFDSDVPLDQRLISAVGEGLDGLAPTDHDVVVDWNAELARTHMTGKLTLILGNEVTPDIWPMPQALGHFGVFPVPLEFDASSYQLSWQSPAGLLERLDTLFPDSVIQVHHPRWDSVIGYLDAAAFNPLDPEQPKRLGLDHLDAIELWNSHEVDATGGTPIEAMLEDYFALIDLGYPLVATGNSDTHELSRQPLGYPRNCIRVPDDTPDGLTPEALIDGLGLGQTFVTSGPWLDVTLEGRGPGETLARPAQPVLQIGVDAASWVPVDRAHVYVNGRKVSTHAIDQLPAQLAVPLELPAAASYILVLVEGDAPLPVVAGEPHHPPRSLAFSNPIWVMP
jgi:hypothetical protein